MLFRSGGDIINELKSSVNKKKRLNIRNIKKKNSPNKKKLTLRDMKKYEAGFNPY